MAHLKRQQVPKSWVTPRKGKTFVVRPLSDINTGVPILIAIRDMLNIAKNRKEVKKAIYEKNILLNNRVPQSEKNSITLFDVITLVPSKESYRLSLSENGKFVLDQIDAKKMGEKISKVIGKKVLKGKKKQLNLGDGRNFLSDIKCKINDSVLVNIENKKIEKCLELKEKASVLVFAGKHTGKQGIISNIGPEMKTVQITIGKDKINVLTKQIIVTK